MDQTALVEKDVQIGRDIIGLLTAAGIPIDDAFWAYAPEIAEWRLMLACPKVKTLGLQSCYMELSRVLHGSPLLREIPLQRISLVAPDDDMIQRLRRLENFTYEGALHIVRFTRGSRHFMFHVTFAPYRGPGGAIPSVAFKDETALRNFLQAHIGIDESDIQKTIRELQVRGSCSFPNVQLTTSQLRRYRLLPPTSASAGR